MIAQVEALIDGMLTEALGRDSIEIVNEFALPVQSRALTHLLNVPASEGETWIGWGIHVFKVTGGEFKKGNFHGRGVRYYANGARYEGKNENLCSL